MDQLITEEQIKSEEEFFGEDPETIIIYLIIQLQKCKDLLFLDPNTGEILHQIPLTPENLNKKLEELLPAALFSFPFMVIAEPYLPPLGGGDDDEKAKKLREAAQKMVENAEELENGYEISTPYETKRGQCYSIDGVRLHKPPMDSSFYTSNSNRPLLKFTDQKGADTDVFYGMLNDFNEWFIGKAGTGKKFRLYVMQDEKWCRVAVVRIRLNDEEVKIMQDLDDTWTTRENLAAG